MNIKEYHKKYGIKRIALDKVKRTGLSSTNETDRLECPYCNQVFEYESEETDSLIKGTTYQCPFCEKNFYVEAEVSINTICTPLEDYILDNEWVVKEQYKHVDECEKAGLEWDEDRAYSYVEWTTYTNYAVPLFKNGKMDGEEYSLDEE